MITYIIIILFGILFIGWEYLLFLLGFFILMLFLVACCPDWFDV